MTDVRKATVSAVVSYHLLVLRKFKPSMPRLVNGPQPTVQDIRLEILHDLLPLAASHAGAAVGWIPLFL